MMTALDNAEVNKTEVRTKLEDVSKNNEEPEIHHSNQRLLPGSMSDEGGERKMVSPKKNVPIC